MTISRKKRQFFIACIDIIILVSAVYLSLWLRDMRIPSIARFSRHIPYFIPIIAAWVVCLYTAGFYSLEMPHIGYRTVSFIAIIAIICTLFGFAFFYLNLRARLVPKTILVIYSLIVSWLIIIWRWIYNGLALRFAANTDIAFVGINDTVIELLKNMRNFSYMSYNVLFLYTEKPGDYDTNKILVINDPVSYG